MTYHIFNCTTKHEVNFTLNLEITMKFNPWSVWSFSQTASSSVTISPFETQTQHKSDKNGSYAIRHPLIIPNKTFKTIHQRLESANNNSFELTYWKGSERWRKLNSNFAGPSMKTWKWSLTNRAICWTGWLRPFSIKLFLLLLPLINNFIEWVRPESF